MSRSEQDASAGLDGRSDMLNGCEVQKRDYSRSPWRIMHVPSIDGSTFGDKHAERYVETEAFDHPSLGVSVVPVVGYRTKREAKAALALALARHGK